MSDNLSDKKPLPFYGEGGGKGGGGKPTIHPDGLFAQSLMEAVVAISEGPIAGLVDQSFQHVLLDETPVIAANGTPNFEENTIALGLNKGDELVPTPIPFHLKGAGVAYGVGATLNQGQPVTRTTPAVRRGLFNQLEVVLNLQRLLISNTEGQMRANLSFQIDYARAGEGNWTPFPGSPFNINNKTTTGVKLEYRARVSTAPEDVDYDIRVTRLSQDSTTEYLADIQWEAYEVVLTHDQSATKRRHADLAMLHLLGYSNDQFSSLPPVSGIYGGLLVPLPTNYNPKTRIYDESTPWDGSFTTTRHWTDNPFWLIRELVMNERFGMRKYQPLVTINDYELYQLAKDADQMIGHPVGPKYTFNGVLAEPKLGIETLRYIAGTAFANVYDDGRGNLTVVGERNHASVMLLVPESVEAPEQGDDITFNYSFTDTKERFNVINASFVNPNRGWDLEPLPPLTLSGLPEAEDPTVLRFGAQPLDLELPGCIYEHEANRKSVRILVEANTETMMATCTLPMAGQLLQLGDVVELGDAEMGWGVTGRLKALDGAEVTLWSPVHFSHAGTYSLKVQGYLGIEIRSFTLATPGEYAVLTCDEAFEDIPPVASYVIEHPDYVGQAQTFRVMALDEVHGIAGKYQVQLKQLNRAKFDAEEQAYFEGLPEPERVEYNVAPATEVQAAFQKEARSGGTALVLHVSWTASPRALSYEVWASTEHGTGLTLLGTTATTELFVDVAPNNYRLFVRAIGLFGSADSVPVYVTLTSITAAYLAANLDQLTITELGTGFQRRDLHFRVNLSFAEQYQDSSFAIDLFNVDTITRVFVDIIDRVDQQVLRTVEVTRTGIVYTYEQQQYDRTPPSGLLDLNLYLEDYLGDVVGPFGFQYQASLYPSLIGLSDHSRYWGLRVTPQYNFDIYPKPSVRWYLSSQNSFASAELVDTAPTLQYLSVASGQTFFVWGVPDLPFGEGLVYPSNTTGFQVTIPLAVAPPDTPTGVVVEPGSTWAFLSWDTHSNYGTGHTRIYRQETALDGEGQPVDPPQLDMETMWVGASPGLNYGDRGLRSGRGYYYWLSHVNALGEEGPVHAADGTLAITVRNASEILDEIAGELDESVLAEHLRSRIDLIDGPASLEGSVAHQLAVEAQERTQIIHDLEVDQDIWRRAQQVLAAAGATTSLNVDEAKVQIIDERNARLADNEAFAQQIQGVVASVEDNAAAVLQESVARANGDEALAADIAILTARVEGTPEFFSGFETGVDFDQWDTSTAATLTGDTGDYQAGYQSGLAGYTGSAPALSLTSDALGVDLPTGFVTALAGFRAVLSIGVKAPASSPAAEMAVALVTDLGNSGWQTLAPGSDWQDLVFEYNFSESVTAARFLVWADTSGQGLASLLDNLRIRRVPTEILEISAQLLEEKDVRAAADLALAQQAEQLEASLGSTQSSLTATQQALADETQARTTAVEQLEASLGSTQSSLTATQQALANETQARTTAVEELEASLGGTQSSLTATQQALANETQARTTAVDELTSQLEDTQSQITTVQDTLSNEIGSVASQVTVIQAEASSAHDLGEQAMAGVAENEVDNAIRDAAAKVVATAGAATSLNVDEAKALITLEQIARADADEALGQQITTILAQVNNNTSTIQNEQTARADADEALAQQVETVQTSLGGTQATVQTHSEAISQIDENGSTAHQALWGVKATAGEVDAGIGLIAKSGGGSEAVIAAGRVSVFDPANPTNKDDLFVIEGGNVYMNTAYLKQAYIDSLIAAGITAERINALILNAVQITGGTLDIGNNFAVDNNGNLVAANMVAHNTTLTGTLTAPNGVIKRAMIGDAEVDTLKIAGDAVTVMTAGSNLGAGTLSAGNNSHNYKTLVTLTVNVTEVKYLFIVFGCGNWSNTNTVTTNLAYRLFEGGNQVFSQGYASYVSYDNPLPWRMYGVLRNVSGLSGNVTYSFQISASATNNSNVDMTHVGATMSISGAKR